MAQQTAVEWLVQELKSKGNALITNKGVFINVPDELVLQAKAMEKEQSHNYADFCVRCDRDQMKLLDFNDYIKTYTNGL
jgi:hypothetical protein